MIDKVQQPFLCPCSLCVDRHSESRPSAYAGLHVAETPMTAPSRLVPRVAEDTPALIRSRVSLSRAATLCDTLSEKPQSCRHEGEL